MPGRDGKGPMGNRRVGRGLGLCNRRPMMDNPSETKNKKELLQEERQRVQSLLNEIDEQIKKTNS